MKNFDLLTLAIGLGIGFVAKSIFDSDCSCHDNQPSFTSSQTMGRDFRCNKGPVRGWYFCKHGHALGCEGVGGMFWNQYNGEAEPSCATCEPAPQMDSYCTDGQYFLTIPAVV